MFSYVSILANNETFFSHGRMGVFYEIFLEELNRIDGGKKEKRKKKKKTRLTKKRTPTSFLVYYYLFIDLVEEE